MKTIPNLIASLILAISVIGVAIFSVQNATLVSLKFLGYESIQLPVGVVLAFSTGIGAIAGAIVLPIIINLNSQNNRQYDDFEENFVQTGENVDSEWLETGSKDW